MQVDLANYLKKYWLVLVLTGVISAIVALVVTYFLSPAYESAVTVRVAPRSEAVASGALVSANQVFSGTEADVVVSREVAENTVDALGLADAEDSKSFLSSIKTFAMKVLAFLRFGYVGETPAREAAVTGLQRRVETSVLEDSGIVEIRVSWNDPEVAKAIADELAAQYVSLSRSVAAEEASATLAQIEEGFAEREEALALASEELASYKEAHDISASYDPVGPTGLTADVRAELTRLEARMSAAESDYTYWRDLYQGTEADAITGGESIRVLGEANTPAYPEGPDKLLYAAVGFLVGILIGLAVATWMEISNKTIYTADDVSNLVDDDVSVVSVGRADEETEDA